MPQIDLAGQTALVTGAAEGIGLAICRQLLEAGCRVVLNDIRSEPAHRAAREFASLGECRAIAGDAAALPVLEELVEETVRALGGLDILVANAALNRVESFLDFTLKVNGQTLTVDGGWTASGVVPPGTF